MLSPPDLLIIGAAALIFFGPDQLPKVARRAGQVVRDVQNTSQSFIREMERAADYSEHVSEPHVEAETMSPPYEYRSYAEPTPAPEPYAPEQATHEPEHDVSMHDVPMHDPIAGAAPLRSPSANDVAHENASGI